MKMDDHCSTFSLFFLAHLIYYLRPFYSSSRDSDPGSQKSQALLTGPHYGSLRLHFFCREKTSALVLPRQLESNCAYPRLIYALSSGEWEESCEGEAFFVYIRVVLERAGNSGD